jgi:hypothetical protein
MRVDVHRDADLAVAERLHHDARMNALCQQRCTGVPQIVDAHRRELGLAENRLELPPDVTLIERSADAAREPDRRVGLAMSSNR